MTESLQLEYPASVTELEAAIPARAKPLCVDLDGSLVSTDMLLESVFSLVSRKPLRVFALPGWLARGKAGFKDAVARESEIDVSRLPYHEALLDYVREAREDGRRTVLATAASEKIARQIADHLQCFDEVIASSPERNLKGTAKADALVERFGEGGFVYVGNSTVDEPVWRRSAASVVVGTSRRAGRAARAVGDIEEVFDSGESRVVSTLKALRPHQWLKNMLLFVPMLAAHQLGLLTFLQAAGAFVAMSMVASATYLLNDLLDLEADRGHPSKRFRPLAAGTLPLATAMWLAPAMVATGFVIAALISGWFVLCLFSYVCLTVAYSFYLKRIMAIDVMTLASLYTLRVIAGGAACGIAISFWLLAFSMFLFLSLAFVKRVTEVQLAGDTGHDLSRRGYDLRDTEALRSMGVASGYLAVLVIALYINSANVAELYAEPRILWLMCPCALFWVTRLWLKTGRREMHDDPLVFAVRDRVSQVLGVVFAMILLAANLPLVG